MRCCVWALGGNTSGDSWAAHRRQTRDQPGGPADRNHPTGEVVLHVNACHQVYAALVERGVRFLGPPNEPPWGW